MNLRPYQTASLESIGQCLLNCANNDEDQVEINETATEDCLAELSLRLKNANAAKAIMDYHYATYTANPNTTNIAQMYAAMMAYRQLSFKNFPERKSHE